MPATVYISSLSLPTLLTSCVLVTAILTGLRWYLIVVLLFIYLVINDMQHLFIWLVTICTSFRKNVYSVPLSQSLSHTRLFVTPWTAARQASLTSVPLPIFKIGLFEVLCCLFWVSVFVYLPFSLWVLYIFWILTFYQISDLQIFIGCLFILLIVFFVCRNFLVW